MQDVQEWCDSYRKVAQDFRDSDGQQPKHSWFYRYDYPNFRCINILSRAVFDGIGEIEFHLHHGNSTPETYEQQIKDGVRWFQSAGAMRSQGEAAQDRFGYIAGNWALDNGQGRPEFSGVDDEIGILSRNGCYGDFTFPAFGEASQPPIVNEIYSVQAAETPRSYWTGTPLAVGSPIRGDLILFEGPLSVDFQTGYIEYGSLEEFTPYFSRRLGYWRAENVHVRKRSEWTFIKLHTHGMQSRKILFESTLPRLFSDLVECISENTSVHFVTAREMYNMAIAAVAGYAGNPARFRDFQIGKPFNRECYVSVPYRPIKFTDSELRINLDHKQSGYLELQRGPIRRIEFDADVPFLDVAWNSQAVQRFEFGSSGKAWVSEHSGLKDSSQTASADA